MLEVVQSRYVSLSCFVVVDDSAGVEEVMFASKGDVELCVAVVNALWAIDSLDLGFWD
jgi:hypothetical protein